MRNWLRGFTAVPLGLRLLWLLTALVLAWSCAQI